MKLGLTFTLWLAAAIIGLGYTMDWSLAPGSRARESRPELVEHGVQLQAIVHPLCPCSASTLNLIAEAVSASAPKPSIEIIFCGNQQETNNVRLAKSIIGARVQFISEAESQKRFGFATSGHVFVWRQGDLKYSGGITDARGEETKGVAFERFSLALSGSSSPSTTMPVYGCPIQGER